MAPSSELKQALVEFLADMDCFGDYKALETKMKSVELLDQYASKIGRRDKPTDLAEEVIARLYDAKLKDNSWVFERFLDELINVYPEQDGKRQALKDLKERVVVDHSTNKEVAADHSPAEPGLKSTSTPLDRRFSGWKDWPLPVGLIVIVIVLVYLYVSWPPGSPPTSPTIEAPLPTKSQVLPKISVSKIGPSGIPTLVPREPQFVFTEPNAHLTLILAPAESPEASYRWGVYPEFLEANLKVVDHNVATFTVPLTLPNEYRGEILIWCCELVFDSCRENVPKPEVELRIR